MKKVLMDSGPMIALFDASDRYHQDAVDFIRTNRIPLITTLASVTETLHMLDFSRQAQLDFLEWIHRGAVEIRNIGCAPSPKSPIPRGIMFRHRGRRPIPKGNWPSALLLRQYP